MVEFWQLILAVAGSSLVTMLITGFGMSVSFDKRIALLVQEVAAGRRESSFQIAALERSLSEIKEWLRSHDDKIDRIDHGRAAFQPARRDG